MAILNYIEAWEPTCWCIATLQLCGRFVRDEEEDGEVHYPAQWIWAAWKPRDNALPRAAPDGWGILLADPEEYLAEVIGEVPVYVLNEFETDWPTLLDIQLECGNLPPWIEVLISEHRAKAVRRRHEYWLTLYGDDRPSFEGFMRNVLMGCPQNWGDPVAGWNPRPRVS